MKILEQHYGGLYHTLKEAIQARDNLRDKLWSTTIIQHQSDEHKK